MSNETDLDWLARNAHKWVANELLRMKPCDKGDETFRASWCYSGDGGFTKAQWLARRAELQNKPNWADAPEWAQWLSQESNGIWYWHAEKPTKAERFWRSPVRWAEASRGELLGDWRDTLERRPVDLSERAVTERLDESTQIVLAAAPELKGEQYRFDPEFKPVSVSNETVPLEQPVVVARTGNCSASESVFLIGRVIDLLRSSMDHFSADELADMHELCDAELTKRDAAVCGGHKYMDATWFERGGLPPVGAKVTIVEVEGYGLSDPGREFIGEECRVMAAFIRPPVLLDVEAKMVAVMMQDGGCGCFRLELVRPIRTERDVLLSVIVEEMNHYDTDVKLADAILAAGFSLGAK